MNNTITWAQSHTAAVLDEVGQFMVHFHVHGLGVSRCVAEGLHHQISREAQTGQVFQFVAGHGTRGVLGTHSGHLGFAVSTWANTFHATCLAHHFLRQTVALG